MFAILGTRSNNLVYQTLTPTQNISSKLTLEVTYLCSYASFVNVLIKCCLSWYSTSSLYPPNGLARFRMWLLDDRRSNIFFGAMFSDFNVQIISTSKWFPQEDIQSKNVISSLIIMKTRKNIFATVIDFFTMFMTT